MSSEHFQPAADLGSKSYEDFRRDLRDAVRRLNHAQVLDLADELHDELRSRRAQRISDLVVEARPYSHAG